MAADAFHDALDIVLSHEGGFSDHRSDPGGATNLGITRATLAAFRKAPVTRDDVKRLGREEAARIYRALYWDRIDGDALPAGVDLMVFDYAVNSGPERAVRTLQTLAGAPADGRIGPATRAAVAAADPAALISGIASRRTSFLRRLPTFGVFGRGWTRRVERVTAAALAMRAPARRTAPAASAVASPAPRASSATIEAPAQALPIVAATPKKPFWRSRTVIANAVGLAAFVLAAVGVELGDLDQNALAEAVLQAVTAGSFIASALFRIVAKARIG
jgi:lysozyme family protein